MCPWWRMQGRRPLASEWIPQEIHFLARDHFPPELGHVGVHSGHAWGHLETDSSIVAAQLAALAVSRLSPCGPQVRSLIYSSYLSIHLEYQ